MADSNFRGPLSSMGSLEVQAGNTATIEPLDGPSLSYQDTAAPDIRFAPFAKDGMLPARVPAFSAGLNIWACDNIPQARTSTMLAASQVVTAAVAVSLVTAAPAGVASAATLALGVPIIPVGTSVATTAAFAIDFGFTTGTTVANSSTIAVIDNTLFKQGQWLVVGNVGNTAASRSLLTQVLTISSTNSTTITVGPNVPATGLASVPIGQANLYDAGLLPPATQFGPAAASASAHAFGGAIQAGLARVYNPRETLARNIAIQGLTAGNYSAVVSGWDVWGNPMTEVITLTSATTAAGKRAFKYIGSITSGTTAGLSFSFGLGDTFGFPTRVDEWEQTDIFWNGAAAVNSNGFTAAVLGPATSTSGDVRGTIQVSTAITTGVIATAISAVATNGTSRLAIVSNVGVWNQIYGTPLNTVPMFGSAQSTATT